MKKRRTGLRTASRVAADGVAGGGGALSAWDGAPVAWGNRWRGVQMT